MWEYRLALSEEERTLLILHIWEIVGKKFIYYFLDKNCAYRLAELLDLAVDEDVVGRPRGWYVPVELFHRLHDMDRTRRRSASGPLIQSVQYLSSSQRRLFHQLQLLTLAEWRAFAALVREGVNPTSIPLQQFAPERKIVLLDALLAYQQYRLIAEKSDSLQPLRQLKDQILLTRLQLPAHPVLEPTVPTLPSPAEGQRPMAFGASLAVGNEGRPFLRLSWSPFKQERVGRNSLEGDELAVLDLAIGVFQDEQELFLDQLDVVRLFNMKTFSVPIVGENPLSWNLRTGVIRVEENGGNHHDGVVSVGAGHAWQWNRVFASYGMLDLAAHTRDPLVRIRPHAGLRMDLNALRMWAYVGAESSSYDGRFSDVWGGKLQYGWSARWALQIEFANDQATRTSVGLNWYW